MTNEQKSYDECRYYAFISYSSKNEEWAKWLQHGLETYKLPMYVQKKHPNMPKKLFPVFRDDTDLTGPVLMDALKKALAQSKYLIVLCSPESAKSEWVGFEIEYFSNVRGADKIFPVIVSGTPYSDDPKTECFHDAIKNIQSELLGISVAELGKRISFLKLISGMLGISADELIRRDRARRIRRNILLASLGALLLASAAYGIYFNTEHSSYYRSYITKNEIPIGVGELSDAEQRTTHGSYRIVTKRGKTVRIESVNSRGSVENPFINNALESYPINELIYDSKGRVSEIIQKNKHGSVAERRVLTHLDDGRVIVDSYSPNSTFATTMSASLTEYNLYAPDTDAKSEIVRRINTYTEEGYLELEQYFRDTVGTRGCDSNGIYGKQYTYTPEGFAESIFNLNENDDPVNCRYGWSERRFEYNEFGMPLREATYNTDGELCRDKDGYAVSVIVYGDVTLYPERLSRYNESDELCRDSDGVAEYELSFDTENGFMTSVKYYDENGGSAEIYGGAFKEIRVYSSSGLPIRTEYYDIGGNPIIASEAGSFALEIDYDKNGRPIEYRSYGIDGKPCRDVNTGAHIMRAEYDDNGFMSAYQFLDKVGNPVKSSYGFARCEYERYDNGNIRYIRNFNTKGTPTKDSNGVYMTELDYDVYGNEKSRRFFDEAERPVLNAFDVSGWDCEYSDGKLMKTVYIGTDGKPTVCENAYSVVEYKYDGMGNIICEIYYGTDGETPAEYDGYFAAIYTYDDYGNTIGTRFYNKNIELTENSEGVAGYNDEYVDGRVKSRKYIGTNGELGTHKDGNSETRYEYDSKGNEAVYAYYGTDGKPFELPEKGYAKARYEYDSGNNILCASYYDANDVPTNGSMGYFKVEYTYDDFGNETSHRYYNTDNNPVYGTDGWAGRDRVFKDGKEVYRAYIGTDGNLMIPESRDYAAVEYEYDNDGNTTVGSYFGTSGEPILIKEGYHKLVKEYNENSLCTYQAYYGTDGELIIPEGRDYAVGRIEYDGSGNRTAISYFGTKDEPILVGEGYHKRRTEYDENGKLIRVSYHSTDGILIVPLDTDHAMIEAEYDVEGKLTSYVKYDADKNVINKR